MIKGPASILSCPCIEDSAEQSHETNTNFKKMENKNKNQNQTNASTAKSMTVHNLIILDESGSMQSIYLPALTGVNETLQTILMPIARIGQFCFRDS